MLLTVDEVLALAPDAASAKAARGLTAAGQWPTRGADAAAVWGECQGSGAKPYQTQVDLSGPAFRCSCPSRKFPCKHGLALLLMRAQDAGAFAAAAAPAWVTEWLASRSDKAQKKEERDAAKAAAPAADPAAAAEREALRWTRLAATAAELQRWLADQVARGLGSVDPQTRPAWQTMAARLVDQQAPGLGQRLRDAADGLQDGDDWPERTLHRLGLMQLACEGLQRAATLPPALRADLRTVAGWPLDRADVLAAGDVVADRWRVLGAVTEPRDDRLVERRVWLHGERSGRMAWLLEHAFGGRGFESSWTPATSVDATLAFHPGAAPLRALPVEPGVAAAAFTWPVGDAPAAWDDVARRAGSNPWSWLLPLQLPEVVVVAAPQGPVAVAGGRALPLRVSETERWLLLAACGGHPVTLFGEWDGRTWRPLLAWAPGAATACWSGRAA